MILGTGIDVVEVRRFKEALDRHGDRLLNRLFTPAEKGICAGRPERLAARFAVKEAVLKALGTGLSQCRWIDVDVACSETGAPSVTLSGGALTTARRLGMTGCHVSLSHTQGTAVAVAIVEGAGTDLR